MWTFKWESYKYIDPRWGKRAKEGEHSSSSKDWWAEWPSPRLLSFWIAKSRAVSLVHDLFIHGSLSQFLEGTDNVGVSSKLSMISSAEAVTFQHFLWGSVSAGAVGTSHATHMSKERGTWTAWGRLALLVSANLPTQSEAKVERNKQEVLLHVLSSSIPNTPSQAHVINN